MYGKSAVANHAGNYFLMKRCHFIGGAYLKDEIRLERLVELSVVLVAVLFF